MDGVWTTWMGCGRSVGAWTRIGWQGRTHAHGFSKKQQCDRSRVARFENFFVRIRNSLAKLGIPAPSKQLAFCKKRAKVKTQQRPIGHGCADQESGIGHGNVSRHGPPYFDWYCTGCDIMDSDYGHTNSIRIEERTRPTNICIKKD